MNRAVLDNTFDAVERFTGSLQHLRQQWSELDSLVERTKQAKTEYDETNRRVVELGVQLRDVEVALAQAKVAQAKAQDDLDGVTRELAERQSHLAATRAALTELTQRLNAA